MRNNVNNHHLHIPNATTSSTQLNKLGEDCNANGGHSDWWKRKTGGKAVVITDKGMTWEVMLVSSGFTLDSGVLGGSYEGFSLPHLLSSSYPLSLSLSAPRSLSSVSPGQGSPPMARGPPPPMPPGQFAPPRPGGGPPQPFPVPPRFGQQPMGPPPPGQIVRGPPAPPRPRIPAPSPPRPGMPPPPGSSVPVFGPPRPGMPPPPNPQNQQQQ
ncbi:uncharacterized protein DS421_7g221510 [Arachis hypogaea]|nr:uncharacterized protein DS421_7g221510 [Arachis hypogaea]